MSLGDFTSSTVTNQPSAQAQQELSQAWTTAQNTAAIPYKPYTGQLTAGLNQGQNAAIGQLQGTYGLAQPYIDSGSQNLSDASNSLGNVSNYLQAGSQAGANASNSYGQATGYGQQSAQALAGMAPYMASANSALGSAGNYFSQAANYAAPVDFNQQTLSQYLNPYTQDVINSTMAQLNQNDQVQASNVASSDIGSGAYGGDRNGIAQAALAGQQDMANNSTVAGLNSANYSQAVGQFNQEQADRYQTAGIYSGLGQGSLSQASGYGNLATQQGQIAQQFGNLGTLANQTGSGYSGLGSLFGSLGQAQAGVGADQGQIGALSGYLGSTAQGQAIAGASAGLQGSTLEQQTQQAQDTANYGQFQNQISYPFQTANMLANIANGQASNLGGSTTNGGSLLSSAVGLATAGTGGLGLLNSGLNSLTPNISNLGAANGGRIGLANGGGLGSAVQHFARGGAMHGLAGLGGVNVMAPIRAPVMAPRIVRHDARPHFDNGGMPITFNPTSAGVPGSGLASGINVNAANPMFGANTGLAGGGGGGMGVGGAGGTPRARAPQQSSGLGAVSAVPSGGGSLGSIPTTGASPATSDPSADTSGGLGLSKNASMGLLAAGLGMMGGTSGNGIANIGQGGLEGIKTYLGLQQQDVANARAQQNYGLESKKVDVDQSRVDLGVKQLNQAAQFHTDEQNIATANLANQTMETGARVAQQKIQTAQQSQIPTPIGMRVYNPTTGSFELQPYGSAAPSAGPAASPAAGASPGSPPASPPNAAPAVQATPPVQQIPPAIAAASVPNGPPMGGATGTWTGPTSPNPPIAAPKPVLPAQSFANQQPDPTSPYAGNTNIPAIPTNYARMNPDYEKVVQGQSGDILKGAETAAQGAANTKLNLAEMQNALQEIPPSGFLAAGPGQQQRAALASKINMTLTGMGIDPKNQINPDAIASSEETKKLSTRMGFDLSRSLGGREPGMVVNMATQSVPTSENSPIGAQRLIAGLSATAQRQIDYNNFAQKWASQTAGDTTGMDNAFNRQNPPQTYADKAVVSTIPPGAVQQLVGNPKLAGLFEQKYGPGTSSIVFRTLNVRGAGQPGAGQ